MKFFCYIFIVVVGIVTLQKMPITMADDSWRTTAFRQSVTAKIDEMIRQSGIKTSKNSVEMENHIFQKAKNKDEYLGYAARLILYVRELKSKSDGCISTPGQDQVGPATPDPTNAQQNLASEFENLEV